MERSAWSPTHGQLTSSFLGQISCHSLTSVFLAPRPPAKATNLGGSRSTQTCTISSLSALSLWTFLFRKQRRARFCKSLNLTAEFWLLICNLICGVIVHTYCDGSPRWIYFYHVILSFQVIIHFSCLIFLISYLLLGCYIFFILLFSLFHLNICSTAMTLKVRFYTF